MLVILVSISLFVWRVAMMNNEFYAFCERATDLMFTNIINKDYGKAELAYFKTKRLKLTKITSIF